MILLKLVFGSKAQLPPQQGGFKVVWAASDATRRRSGLNAALRWLVFVCSYENLLYSVTLDVGLLRISLGESRAWSCPESELCRIWSVIAVTALRSLCSFYLLYCRKNCSNTPTSWERVSCFSKLFQLPFHPLLHLVTSLRSSGRFTRCFSQCPPLILYLLSVKIPAAPVRSTMVKMQRKHTVNVSLIKKNTCRCCRTDPGELVKAEGRYAQLPSRFPLSVFFFLSLQLRLPW